MFITPKQRRLLAKAAEPAYEQIRTDQRRAPKPYRRLLGYLLEHLFDTGFDVKQWKVACNVRDNSVMIDFHRDLGITPRSYLLDLRMETACRLLASTELKAGKIAEILGFTTYSIFSRAFLNWAGWRPQEYRERKDEETPRDFYRRMLEGQATNEEVGPVIARLREIYPGAG